MLKYLKIKTPSTLYFIGKNLFLNCTSFTSYFIELSKFLIFFNHTELEIKICIVIDFT